jgi:hypothetical protein
MKLFDLTGAGSVIEIVVVMLFLLSVFVFTVVVEFIVLTAGAGSLVVVGALFYKVSKLII